MFKKYPNETNTFKTNTRDGGHVLELCVLRGVGLRDTGRGQDARQAVTPLKCNATLAGLHE